MAKQIIILNRSNGPGGDQAFSFLFWLPVSGGQQLPAPGFVSQYRGATLAEQLSLQNGTTVEQSGATQYPAGFSQAQIQADLQTRFAAAQTAFNALPNPNQFYGASWDGVSWAAGSVPPAQLLKRQVNGGAVAASGDNTLVAATAGQGIAVFRLKLVAAAAVTATIKDGAGTTLFGPFAMATGIPQDFEESPTGEPWFVTAAGNAFILNLGSAVSVAVRGSYIKA